MQKFTILGPSGKNNSVSSAIFRDAVEGSIPDARYFGIDALFPGCALVTSALTSHQLKGRMRKSPLLRALLTPARRAAFRSLQRVTLRRVGGAPRDAERRYFIFCLSTHIERISPEMLDDLRRRCPGCRTVYYLIDSIERTANACGMQAGDVVALLDHFDAVYSYDKSDTERYAGHMRYIDIPLWRGNLPRPAAPGAELYFCGRNKRRGELLIELYRRLTEAGLRFELRIAGAGASAIAPMPGVKLFDLIPYDAMIGEMLAANCVLEVLAENNSESTLRYKEAVVYNKKLLTNNPNIASFPYYDPRWMRVFRTVEDVDLDWLRSVEPVDYGYKDDFSLETFLRKVEKLTDSE